MSEQTCCDKNMGEPFTCGQLSQEVRHLRQRITELEQLTSSYAGAVEVEGYVAGVPTDISTELYFASGWSKELGKFNNKKVRVLVMKEVE